MGRAGGGAINVITKSGTNQYHGSAFEFYRDKGMNANTFINNSKGAPKSPYHFNQFGGSFGGPIVKDKLFSSPTTTVSATPVLRFLHPQLFRPPPDA